VRTRVDGLTNHEEATINGDPPEEGIANSRQARLARSPVEERSGDECSIAIRMSPRHRDPHLEIVAQREFQRAAGRRGARELFDLRDDFEATFAICGRAERLPRLPSACACRRCLLSAMADPDSDAECEDAEQEADA
jgi:hypothetical protein